MSSNNAIRALRRMSSSDGLVLPPDALPYWRLALLASTGSKRLAIMRQLALTLKQVTAEMTVAPIGFDVTGAGVDAAR